MRKILVAMVVFVVLSAVLGFSYGRHQGHHGLRHHRQHHRRTHRRHRHPRQAHKIVSTAPKDQSTYLVILLNTPYTTLMLPNGKIALNSAIVDEGRGVEFYSKDPKINLRDNSLKVDTDGFFPVNFNHSKIKNEAFVKLDSQSKLKLDQWSTILIKERTPNGRSWLTLYGKEPGETKFKIISPRSRS